MHPLTIVGIIVIAVGTVFTFLGQQINNNRSNQQLSDKSDKIQGLSEEIIELTLTLHKNSEIDSLKLKQLFSKRQETASNLL